MFSGDFVKLTSVPTGAAHGSHDDDWSDQELLLLLEGVEMFDDDWSLIEEHVGTRSAQQCIRKFLELPIEDPYLAAEGPMGPLRYGRIPFEQADNPVMSVVAFLAGVVGPGVAAEAAQTALHELTDGDKEMGENPSETKPTTSENEEKQEDEMAEDDGMAEDTVKDGSEVPNAEPDTSKPDTSKAGTPPPVADETSAATIPPKKRTVPHSKVVRAADLALKSSAKAAKALAEIEDAEIRSTLASLIRLALTKLELKMSQFEELEEILEDERKGLESARMALVGERLNLKRMLDGVRSELAKNGVHAIPAAIAQTTLGTTGQGSLLNDVSASMLDGDSGPVEDGSLLQLT